MKKNNRNVKNIKKHCKVIKKFHQYNLKNQNTYEIALCLRQLLKANQKIILKCKSNELVLYAAMRETSLATR